MKGIREGKVRRGCWVGGVFEGVVGWGFEGVVGWGFEGVVGWGRRGGGV